jgi:hypothetical protein
MSLDKKNLSELRSIAQSIGVIPDFSIGKEHLLQQIRGHVSKQIEPSQRPIEVNITNIPTNGVTQTQVEEALKGFKELGLTITFPDAQTWSMRCGDKTDSGSMTCGIWAIIGCAREVVKS